MDKRLATALAVFGFIFLSIMIGNHWASQAVLETKQEHPAIQPAAVAPTPSNPSKVQRGLDIETQVVAVEENPVQKAKKAVAEKKEEKRKEIIYELPLDEPFLIQ